MDQLLSQGVELMALGMGIVFSFLIVLVFAMTAMSSVVNRFFPDTPEPAAPARPAPQGNVPAAEISPRTLAIIQDAIRQHRDRQQ